MDLAEIVRRTNSVVVKEFELDEALLEPSATLYEDLGLDSLDSIDLIAGLCGGDENLSECDLAASVCVFSQGRTRATAEHTQENHRHEAPHRGHSSPGAPCSRMRVRMRCANVEVWSISGSCAPRRMASSTKPWS